MKFTPRYDWPRVLTARQAVEFDIAQRDHYGALETLESRVERLTEFVGDILELLPPEQQAALLDRYGFDTAEEQAP